MFDVSKKNTFINVTNWIRFIKQINTEESILILCGNKIDLPREVSANEGKNLAEKENMFYFETSAKNGDGINNMMYTCIALLPFFEQFKITNNEDLIQELMQTNSNNNNKGKIITVNQNREYIEKTSKYSSNIVIIKQNSKKNNKKKCTC